MKKILFGILLSITTFFFCQNIVHAGSLSIYASSKNVIVGSSVTITVNASNLAGTFSITLSNRGVLSGGQSSTWIENGKVTYTFNAKKAGSETITVTPIDAADFDSGGNFTSSKSITINVSEAINYSSDNNLSSLSIDSTTLSPVFNKDVTSYSVKMPKGTTSVNIKANASDSKSSIAGNGTQKVEEGDNNLSVVVTAENGSTKTYNINVIVEEENPIDIKIDNKDYRIIKKSSLLSAPSDLYKATTVNIDKFNIPAFQSEINKLILVGIKDVEGNILLAVYDDKTYKIYNEFIFENLKLYLMDLDDKNVPIGYKKYEIIINEKKINVYKATKKSNFSLMYGLNIETGKKTIYQYDEKENTIQRYNEPIKEKNNVLNDSTVIKIGIVLISIIISFIVVIFIMAFKNKEKKD